MKEFAANDELDRFLMSFVKYNNSYLSINSQGRLLSSVTAEALSSARDLDLKSKESVKRWLPILDLLIRYSGGIFLSLDDLNSLISCLCLSVNLSSRQSLQVMSNLLRSSCTQNCIRILLEILEKNGTNVRDIDIRLIRGAVFFVGMSCWGSQRISSLKYPYSLILRSLVQAVHTRNELVVYEVVLSIRRLIKKYGETLSTEWDSILNILEQCYASVIQNLSSSFAFAVTEILALAAELYSSGKYFGSQNDLFKVLISYKIILNEESIIILLSMFGSKTSPLVLNWKENMEHMLKLFVVKESSVNIRMKALEQLQQHFSIFKSIFGNQIVEHGLLPYMHLMINDTDIGICKRTIDFIESACLLPTCDSKHFSVLVSGIIIALTDSRYSLREKALVSVRVILVESAKIPGCELFLCLFKEICLLLDHPSSDIRHVILDILASLNLNSSFNFRMVIEGQESDYLVLQRKSSTSEQRIWVQNAGLFDFEFLLNMLMRNLEKETHLSNLSIAYRILNDFFENWFFLKDVDMYPLLTFVIDDLKDQQNEEHLFLQKLQVLFNSISFIFSTSAVKSKLGSLNLQDQIIPILLNSISQNSSNLESRSVDSSMFDAIEREFVKSRICISGLTLIFSNRPYSIVSHLFAIVDCISKMFDYGSISQKFSILGLRFLHICANIIRIDPVIVASLHLEHWNRVISFLLSTIYSGKKFPQQVSRALYHAIISWFTLMPVHFRRDNFGRFIQFMIKNRGLFVHPVDAVLIDFLSRNLYAQNNLISRSHPVVDDVYNIRIWISGSCIVAIGSSTLSDRKINVSIRRPTGKSHLLVEIPDLRISKPFSRHETYLAMPRIADENSQSKNYLDALPLNSSQIKSFSYESDVDSSVSSSKSNPSNYFVLPPLPSYDQGDGEYHEELTSPAFYPKSVLPSESNSAICISTDDYSNPSLQESTGLKEMVHKRDNYLVSTDRNSAFEEYSSDKESIDPWYVFRLFNDESNLDQFTELDIQESFLESLEILDSTSCKQLIKIGVLYLGETQETLDEALSNQVGSSGYHKFLRQLGEFDTLNGTLRYSGGLDRKSDEDGKFSVFWSDENTDICFHVATLMPRISEYLNCENKLRHIGNDPIILVYSDKPRNERVKIIVMYLSLYFHFIILIYFVCRAR